MFLSSTILSFLYRLVGLTQTPPSDHGKQLSLEFHQKTYSIKAIKEYYASKPKIAETLAYADTNQYFTTEGIGLLLRDKINKLALESHAHPEYDTNHVKLIEDKHHFPLLKTYLSSFGRLKPNQSIKCLLKIKRGEPSHYLEAFGLHVIPIYIRRCQNELKIFIHDATHGLNADVKDGFEGLPQALFEIARKQFPKNKITIIKSSTITMGEMFMCPIYGLRAIEYFIKQGHQLFDAIKSSHLVRASDKICDKEYPYIKHLKVDRLPPYLMAMTSRLTLEEVQRAYQHPWMPRKIDLSSAYYESTDLLKNVRRVPVEGKTVKQWLSEYGFEKIIPKGPLINAFALKQMHKSRIQVGKSVLDLNVSPESTQKDHWSKNLPIIR